MPRNPFDKFEMGRYNALPIEYERGPCMTKKEYRGLRETTKFALSGRELNLVHPIDMTRDIIESEFGRDNGIADKVEKLLRKGEIVVWETDGCIHSLSLAEDEPTTTADFAAMMLSQMKDDLPPKMFEEILDTFPDEIADNWRND